MRKWADADTPLFDDFKHGVVVTERRWYEQWRHMHPYNKWRLYESREAYSLRDFVANRNADVNKFEAKREAAPKR